MTTTLPPLYESRPGSTALAMATLDQPLKQINDFIWQSDGMTNSYLITTSEGDVVVSTGLVVEGHIHRHKFDQISRAPVKAVILTQAHVDIVGGLGVFKGPDTEVIAHVNTHDCQADDVRISDFRRGRSGRFFPKAIASLSDADKAAMQKGMASAHVKATPTRTVSNRYDFTLGGIRFVVLALPGGETLDSLALWLPDHDIVFTGNAFGPLFPHMPNLHTIRGDRPRPVLPYIETYTRILELRPELLITGHFDVIRGRDLIQTELGRLRTAVQYVHDETVKGMNAGKDPYALMREIRLPPELQVGEDYGTVPWAVQTIWYGYGGWFLYQSTTELYPAPVRDIYADLARLAGADALAELAQNRLVQGKPLEAIHFCEIALAEKPDHQPVLTQYLAAHQQLLEESRPRNRWFQYWLRGEIAETQAKLAATTK